jgi:hypothetical protein
MALLLALDRPEKRERVLRTSPREKTLDVKRESIISMFGSFPPSPLVGLRLQSLLGPGSRHCYGIITLINRLAAPFKLPNCPFRKLLRELRESPGKLRGSG